MIEGLPKLKLTYRQIEEILPFFDATVTQSQDRLKAIIKVELLENPVIIQAVCVSAECMSPELIISLVGRSVDLSKFRTQLPKSDQDHLTNSLINNKNSPVSEHIARLTEKCHLYMQMLENMKKSNDQASPCAERKTAENISKAIGKMFCNTILQIEVIIIFYLYL